MQTSQVMLSKIVGGLIVLGIFIKLWDIGHCTEVFDTFTRQFFGVHLTKGRGFLSRVRDYFRCWLSDGCYNVVVLEEMLKSIFGAEQRIFDINTKRISGCKVAVTATTLSDASAYLFTNYNGGGIRERNCGSSGIALLKRLCRADPLIGYKHVRPERIEDEPFLWEA